MIFGFIRSNKYYNTTEKAMKNCDRAAFNEMIDKYGASPDLLDSNYYASTIAEYALRHQWIDEFENIVINLIHPPFSPDELYTTALCSIKNDESIMRAINILRSSGHLIQNTERFTRVVVNHCSSKIIDYLAENVFDVVHAKNAITYSVNYYDGYSPNLERLIEKGADIRQSYGEDPNRLFDNIVDIKIFRILLHEFEKINDLDKLNWNALLYYYIKHRDENETSLFDCIEFLDQYELSDKSPYLGKNAYGMIANIPQYYGEVENEYLIDIVKQLKKYKQDINYVNDGLEWPPIITAIHNERHIMAATMAKEGADPTIKILYGHAAGKNAISFLYAQLEENPLSDKKTNIEWLIDILQEKSVENRKALDTDSPF